MMIEASAKPSFPFERAPLAPPAEFESIRREEPLKQIRLWNGASAWIVTRQEDFRNILADNRFSVNPLRPGYPNVSEARAQLMLNEEPTLARLDPPEHTGLRRMLAKEFTPARMTALRASIQQTVEQLVADMIDRGPPADFYRDFALPIPSIVISQMLGVPYSEHELFEEWAAKKLAFNAPPEVPLAASVEMRDYMDRLIAKKERDPGDDLVTRLLHDQIQPGHLSREEAVRLCEFLLVAGHETTANMIALGTLSLLLDRDQYECLKADPSLSGRAIEEMLRFHSIVQYGLSRVATADVEINGCLIREGDGVISLINAANWDPAAHPDPDRFDIRKKRTMHVAFGFGVHQCLGQPLARLEMDVVFATLPNLMPTLELAVAPQDVAFKQDALVYGVERLPVTWQSQA